MPRELGIIHRDIKPANIMLEQATSGSVITYRPVVAGTSASPASLRRGEGLKRG